VSEHQERSDASVVAAAERLSAAFGARDVVAALACFVTDDDIGYVGSENAENAAGRAAVEALFKQIFARDEAYSWQVTNALVRVYGDCAYLFAEADGLVHTDAGDILPFAYRISGVLEKLGDLWTWRHCHGCEPAGDGRY
jgi:ketosteroid isomerase-like protein